MALDKTTIRIEGDKYIIERNHACVPIGVQEPLLNQPDVMVTPGMCYNNLGEVIKTESGLPVFVPRRIEVPITEPFERVLERAEGMKAHQADCPACARIKNKIENGEIVLPPEIQREIKEEPERRDVIFPRLENLRPHIFERFTGF